MVHVVLCALVRYVVEGVVYRIVEGIVSLQAVLITYNVAVVVVGEGVSIERLVPDTDFVDGSGEAFTNHHLIVVARNLSRTLGFCHCLTVYIYNKVCGACNSRKVYELCRRSIILEFLRGLQCLRAYRELNILVVVCQLVHARLLDDSTFLVCSHPRLECCSLRSVLQERLVVDGKLRRTAENVRLAGNARAFGRLSCNLCSSHSLSVFERYATVYVARRCAETNVSKFLLALKQIARAHHLSLDTIVVDHARNGIHVVIVIVVLSLVALSYGYLLIVCIRSAMLLAVDYEALEVALAAPRQFNSV